jgi:hypothetical protein
MNQKNPQEKPARPLQKRTGQWRRAYQKYFATAFLIAAALHLTLTISYQIATQEPPKEVSVLVERKEYELIQPPVKFELRAPRLAKSFSVSKTPSYVQAFTPREIRFTPTEVTRVEQVSVAASAGGRTGTARASQVEGSIFYGALTGGSSAEASWGIPGGAVAFGRSLGVGGKLGWGEGQTAGVDFRPDLNEEVINTRTAGTGLQTMRNELVSYENFSDRFEGWVEQDPRNKKSVRGTINFYQLRWRATKSEPNGEEGWNVFPKALLFLQEYAHDSTEVRVNLAGNLRLSDRQLFDVPILFMMGYNASVQYTKEEAKNLGKWLRQGGFLFVDDGYAQESGAFNQSARALLKEALGYDAEFERIPGTHRLYHAWEDFDGPPAGSDDIKAPQLNGAARATDALQRYPYLEGIFLNGRLAVLFSTKGYTDAWGRWRYLNPPYDNARQLHFGINIVVFASTEKGGIIAQNKAKVATEYQKK